MGRQVRPKGAKMTLWPILVTSALSHKDYMGVLAMFSCLVRVGGGEGVLGPPGGEGSPPLLARSRASATSVAIAGGRGLWVPFLKVHILRLASLDVARLRDTARFRPLGRNAPIEVGYTRGNVG